MLTDVCMTSKSEWFTATVTLEDSAYEIVFTVHLFDALQCETRELVQVEEDGLPVSDDSLWKRIGEILKEEREFVRLRVEIDENWLDILKELIGQILTFPPCSPVEELEFEIFSQIQKQIG
jgi:hypothetical protein